MLMKFTPDLKYANERWHGSESGSECERWSLQPVQKIIQLSFGIIH